MGHWIPAVASAEVEAEADVLKVEAFRLVSPATASVEFRELLRLVIVDVATVGDAKIYRNHHENQFRYL